MPSPFPGMDPFVERPAIFADFHDAFVNELRNDIARRLPPPYFSGLRSRIWIEERARPIYPDVTVVRPESNGGWSGSGGGTAVAVEPGTDVETLPVTITLEELSETFLEVRYAPDGERLVTSIEVLSPANKTPGDRGQSLYLQKQSELLESDVHLIEIDLLRGGTHTTAIAPSALHRGGGDSTWHILLRRSDRPIELTVYPIQIWHRLPKLEVPLLPEHGAITVPLQPLFDRCYEFGRYDLRAKYDEPLPPPPLRPVEAEYVAQRLAAAFPDRSADRERREVGTP